MREAALLKVLSFLLVRVSLIAARVSAFGIRTSKGKPP
jgi:hypothetical protein